MATLFSLLAALCGLGAFVCFVIVIIKMFQHNDPVLAVVSLVLLLCGIGGLVAFVAGWMKSAVYGIPNVMMA